MKKTLFAALLFTSISLMSCSGGAFVVTTRPEPPIYTRPIAPGADYIWIDGDWIYSGGRYVWHEGHWDRSRPNRQWQPGSWQQRGNGYAWRRGGWH